MHCYLQLSKKCDITKPEKLYLKLDAEEYKGNFQGVKSDEHVIKYCIKDGNFIASKSPEELTNRHESRVGKKKIIGKELMQLANVKALAEHVRDVRPELHPDYKRIRESFILHKLDIEPVPKMAGCRGIWIKGSPGIGKTHCVLEKYGDDVYEKS